MFMFSQGTPSLSLAANIVGGAYRYMFDLRQLGISARTVSSVVVSWPCLPYPVATGELAAGIAAPSRQLICFLHPGWAVIRIPGGL